MQLNHVNASDWPTRTKVFCLICGIVNCFVDGLIYVITGVITEAVADDLKCTDGFVSFWGGIELAIIAGSGPFSAVLLRRLGMKKLGTITGLTSFGALYLLSVARNTLMLAIAMCLQGLCIGILYTSSIVVVAHIFTTRFSQVNIILLVAGVLANGTAPLIQIMMENYGWRGAIAILAAVHLHVPVSSMLLNSSIGKSESDDEEDPTEQNTLFQNVIGFFKTTMQSLHVFKDNSQLVALFLSGVCNGFSHATYYLFMIPYAVGDGISPFDASTLKALPILPCILVRIVIFFLGEIDVSCIVRMYAVAQVAEFFSCFLLTFGGSLSMFYVGSILHGFAFGIQFYSILCLAPALVERNVIDYALSWCIFSEGLAAIATAIVGLCTTNYHLGFQINLGVQCFAIALVFYMIIGLTRAPNPS